MKQVFFMAAMLAAGGALAQHGAGDDRVNLPEGPGSLQGVGDNAAIGGNMGSMSYDVPIELPAGFPGVTPQLALSYDSAAPAGVMGIGWDLPLPFIERMTNWRLPDYTVDDDFVAGGQLVHIGNGVYRNRFEQGFARHTWHDRGDGTQGYWTTEQPDGTVQYYGATADGDLVDSARMAGRLGATFRYHLVEAVDKFGHRMTYSYRTYDGMPYLDRIAYIFTGADGGPGASVTFEYEERPDALTDARSGAIERRTRRLTAVNVFSKATRIWRYRIQYEATAAAGGLSRVQRIDRVGLGDTPHPVAFDFAYTQTPGDVCDEDCDQPYLVDMGSLGINLAAGDATLADMNGDALPDIIDTSRDGAHRVFLNRYGDRDDHTFAAPVNSAVGTRAGHQLSSPYVQALDANGDGRVDLVNVRTGEVLYNLGTGDWSRPEALGSTAALPDFGDDFGGGADEPAHVRFFDYDNDRRIDVMRSTLDQTQIFANLGEAGFAVVDDVQAIGAGFDAGLDLADINGDGLLDPVIVRAGSLSYRLNLGHGRWSAWVEINDLPFNEAQREFVQLQDLNGDALDDLVLVVGDTLRYALNRGGTRFDEFQTINQVGGRALPVRVDGTTVLFADMNGSGSDDVVWISPQGEVTYLELFPVRPNLLTRVTNGLGLVTDVTYTALVAERARAARPWAYTLPFPMWMASTVDTYDSLSAQHRRMAYTYADAYYDTQEKAYRGFAEFIVTTPVDETQVSGVSLQTSDVGADDRYRNGLLLTSEMYALEGDDWAPLRATASTYEDCDVDEVPANGLAWPIRYVCKTAEEVTLQERAPEAEWVRTRNEYTYDGYGNVVVDASLGVVSRGGGCGACARDAGHFGAPCGATCEGDEFYVQSDYTRAADAWILGLLVRQAAAAVLDSAQAKVVEFFYDGPDFTGLAAGQATLGQLMRKRFQLDDRTWIDAERRRYDEHGNVVESVATAGTPGQGGHRILTTYDDEGLLVTANELTLDGYSVRSEQQYDPIWGAVNQASGPRVYVDGRAVTPEHQTRLVYDDLGHLVSRANPGDPADRPTATFEFEYGAPVSRVVSHFRSVRGAAQPDRRTIECQDGFGRTTAQLVDVGGEYVVGGYQVANRLGAVVVSHLVSTTRNDNCLLAEPDRAATRMRYDALGRLIGTTRDDADLYGQASRTLNTFEPLVRHRYLPDDTDPNDPRADTPVTQIFDGLGRQTAMRLRETANGEPLDFTYEFDVRGDLVQVNGPAGDVRTFERDRAGRVVAAEDADRGRSALTLDAAGNVVRSEDAEGRVVEMTYDALNRLVAEWDAADPAGTRREYLFDRPDHCPDGLCPEGALQQVGMTFPTPEGRGARWITHDDRGRLAAVTTVLDGYALSEAYTYDNLGGLLTATSPDGTVDRRTYDALGRVASIDGIADLSWTLGTLLSRTALANGVTVARTYDVLDRPATLDITGPSGPLAQLRYGHDRLGSLTAIDDLATPADQPGRGARFTYDALDRLVSAHLDPGRAAFEEVLTYGYDRRMNLVDKRSNREGGSRSHVGALTYDADRPHAVVSAGDRTYGYDDAGLMIDHNGLLVGWDAWHRPVDVERDGVVVERHWYADDRILSESATASRVFVNPNFEVEDGMALTHYHVGLDRIATVETDALAADVLGDLAPLEGGVPAPDGAFDTGDAVVAALAEGGSVALPAGAHHASVRTMLRGSVRSRLLAGEPRTTFIHSDATRSRFLETDADGQVLARHATDPHGLDRQGPAGRGFEGRRTDTATGLVRMGARSFDPWLGRWTSPDPEFTFGDSPLELSSPGEGSDPYGLLASNPVGRTDPSGRSAELAAALDRASVSPNYNLGQLARPGVTADTYLDFAFNDNYVEMQAAVKETVQQLSTQLTRDLEDARFNLQGEELMLAALQEPNLGNEVSESTIADNIRRVGEAKAAVKAQELRLAEFEIGRRAVARNVAAVQKAYRYRVNNGATRADLRPLANRSVGHFNRLHAISQAAFARAGRIASAIHRRNHSLAIKRKGQLANIKVTKQNAPAPVAKRQNSSKI